MLRVFGIPDSHIRIYLNEPPTVFFCVCVCVCVCGGFELILMDYGEIILVGCGG